MKKSELKAMIKQCVKEALFEEGVLSEIIAEVAFGLTKAQNIMSEQKTPQNEKANTQQDTDEVQEERRRRLLETKRKMINAMGNSKMSNVFEGTEPLTSGGLTSPSAPQGPLSGRDPSDAGVDISGLFSLAGQKWKQLK